MKRRCPPCGILLIVAAACAGAVTLAVLLRARPEPQSALLARLPQDRDTTLLKIDFQALREAGLLKLLAPAGVTREPEYQAFVEQTGFDYQQDLDIALVSFHRNGTFYLLRGRFQWRSLRDYAVRQGGKCLNTRCGMPGSTPQRWISFTPVKPDLMALAVSPEPYAADYLFDRNRSPVPPNLPADPVWALVSPKSLPAILAEPLGGADRILVSLNATALVLDVTCPTPEKAAVLSARLHTIAGALRDKPGGLATLIAAGTIDRKDHRILARWPLDRRVIEALAGGAAL